MSKLEELMAELCPDGVPFRTIGECVKPISNIKWSCSNDAEYQYIDLTSVNRDTHNIGETQTICADNAPSRAQQIVYAQDILLGTTRPLLRRFCVVPNEYSSQMCSTGFCVLRADENIVLHRWLYHQISTSKFFDYVEKHQKGASYPAISDADVKKFRIPIPPLPVQREIVRILDNFAELTAELTARKQQYAYYRDKLLHNATTTVYKRLGDFCDLLSGFPFDSSKFKEDGIRLMRGMNIKRGYLDFAEENNRYWESTDGVEKYLLNDQDIVISMDGSLVGSSYGMVSKKDLPLLLVQRVTRIRTNQANIRYVYHYIASGRFTEYVHKKKTAGAIPHISLKDISNFEVPLPSLEIQKRLVEVLDNFDVICTDLSSGLPAEIEARQKQYEYYRDKLLSFEEKI